MVDIVFVLSGGSSNYDPNLSLGGEPGYPLQGSLNNLFSNITSSEAQNGYTDYRCIYIFNDSNITLYNTQISLSQDSSGSDVYFGVIFATDTQTVTLTGIPTDGSFTLSYESISFTVNYDPEPSVFASNFTNALAEIGGNPLVTLVTAPAYKFTVNFQDNVSQPLLEFMSNNLTGVSQISITKVVQGAPINSIANTILNSTTIPTGVDFAADPISIGTLYSGEGFPIWFKRVTPAGAASMLGDGFVLEFQGSPIAVS